MIIRKILTSILLTGICCLLLVPARAQYNNSTSFWSFNEQSYGVKATLNYSMSGTRYGKYSGLGQYSLGLFGSTRYNWLSITVEPAFSVVSFREQQSDNRYVHYFADLSAIAYAEPFSTSALKFYLGIRPSYLLAHQTEVFNNGVYTDVSDDSRNKNKNGQINMGVSAGVAVSLSDVVDFELGYFHSFSEQTDLNQVKGRPSTVELTLRLNAINLRNRLTAKQKTIQESVQTFKRGDLYVMLMTPNQKEIDRLRKAGADTIITEIENELRMRNLKIMNTFKSNYSFNTVRFFMDTSVYKLLSGNRSGIFVNTFFEPDTAQVSDTTPFLIGSFCDDISDYTKKYVFGFYMYDPTMKQLEKPFNVPGNMFSVFSEGDPFNYLRRKRYNYFDLPYDKIIKKFDSRMNRFLYLE